MMGFLSTVAGSRYKTEGTDASLSLGTAADSGTTANTKGTWAVIDASTVQEAMGLTLHVVTTTAAQLLIDIAVGATSSEKIICPNLLHGVRNNIASQWPIPIYIPAGTQINARVQSAASASRIAYISLTLWEQGFLHTAPLARMKR